MIIIDAGHGGKDPGATTNGIKEKDWTLEVSLHQQEFLRELGIQTLLTRKQDNELNPENRSKAVKNSGATICISNHFNAGGGRGAEVIHSIFSNGNLARSAGKAMSEDGMPLRRVYSKAGRDGRDYYFMHRLTGAVETIIVEYGFLDSTEDMKRLRSSTFRLKLAESVALAVVKYAKLLPSSLYVVQTGVFQEKQSAIRLCNELIEKGYEAIVKEEN